MEDKNYVDLQGTHNFRDIGGYPTKDGKRVAYGKLFRSDDLHELTQEDISYLQSMGLKTIIDYRNEHERTKREDVNIPGVTTYYLDPKADTAALASSSFAKDEKKVMKTLTAAQARHMMIEQNRQFVLSDTSKQAYRAMFDVILDENNIAVDQHCRGGKDRTGFGIALILSALGVSKKDILHDYMLTNHYKHEKNERSLKKLMEETQNADLVQAVRYMKEAQEEFLLTALDLIEELYGDTLCFLKQELHLQDEEIEKLKALYLEN